MRRPALMTLMRSATRATSSRWWLETRIPAPAAALRTRASRTSRTPAGSRALVGSSRTMTSGWCCRAAARPMRCRLPRDSRRAAIVCVLLDAQLREHTVDHGGDPVGLDRVQPGCEGEVVSRGEFAVGQRVLDQVADPLPRRRSRLIPAMWTVPVSGRSMPSSSRMRVDLPAPLSPTSAWIWPASTSRSMPCTPAPPRKRRLRPRAVMRAVHVDPSRTSSTMPTASAKVSVGLGCPLEERSRHRAHGRRGGGPSGERGHAIGDQRLGDEAFGLAAVGARRTAQGRSEGGDPDPAPHQVAVRLRQLPPRGPDATGHPQQGGQRVRLPGYRGRDDRVVRVVEQHVLLGREVAEKRHRRHPGRRRDLRHRRRLESLPLEQLQRALQQPLPGPLPLAHDQKCYSLTFRSASRLPDDGTCPGPAERVGRSAGPPGQIGIATSIVRYVERRCAGKSGRRSVSA